VLDEKERKREREEGGRDRSRKNGMKEGAGRLDIFF